MTWCARLLGASLVKYTVADNPEQRYTRAYLRPDLTVFPRAYTAEGIPFYNSKEEAEAALWAARIKGVIP